MVHQSVKERELSVHNEKPKPGERSLYKPWILDTQHAHQIEPWTHLEDWKNDPEWLKNTDERTVKALEGWCVPTRGHRAQSADRSVPARGANVVGALPPTNPR